MGNGFVYHKSESMAVEHQFSSYTDVDWAGDLNEKGFTSSFYFSLAKISCLKGIVSKRM